MGFPGGKESASRCRRRGRPGFSPRKIPCRRAWQATPVVLPEKSHGQRSLPSYSPWGHKESDATERTHITYHLFIVYPASIIYSTYQSSACINYSIRPAISSSQTGKYLLAGESRIEQSAACWPKGHRCPAAGPGYDP